MLSRVDDDHLLMAPPLRRKRVCGLFCVGLTALLGFATLVHLGLIISMRREVASVFYRALALSSLLALVPIALLWFLERRERQNLRLFAAAFLWGGCIATALALPLNTAFFRFVDEWVVQYPMIIRVLGPEAGQLLAAPISAPIAEEIAKALGVLVMFRLLRGEFDHIRDGIVYGALIGLGFTWYESALYVAQGYAEYGVAPYGYQLGGRYALLGLGGHAMFTGIFGAFLGLGLQARRQWIRVLAPIFGLMLAIAAHMLINVLPLLIALASAIAGEPPTGREPLPDVGFLEAFGLSSLLQLTLFLPFLLITAVALWWSSVWERRVIREELAGEVGRAVNPDEYRSIVDDRMLRTRRIDPMRPYTSAALVNAQHELAFRKRRVRDEGNDPERDRIADGWRGDIQRLREAG